MKKVYEIDKRRLFMCLFGIIFCGVAVGMILEAGLGVDPFTSFVTSISKVTAISYGTLYTIVSLSLLIFTSFFNRKMIGIGTVVGLLFSGYVAEFTQKALSAMFPSIGMCGRIILLLFGLLIMCIASSVYFTAEMGVSAYDSIALIISNTWNVGKFRNIRMLTDLVCVCGSTVLFLFTGASLSEVLMTLGFGTVIAAFFMGPAINWFSKNVAAPLCKGKFNILCKYYAHRIRRFSRT